MRLHTAAHRFEVVGKFAGTVQCVFRVLARRALTGAAFGGLDVFQHIFNVAVNDLLAVAGQIDESVSDQLIVLANAVRDAVIANTIGRRAQFIARRLLVLSHPARRLIEVAFEPFHLLGKRLLAFGELLLLLGTGGTLPVMAHRLKVAGNFFLFAQRFLRLLT